MRHFASSTFWQAYDDLPAQIRELADKNYVLLKNDSKYPSLHFKKIGDQWSVRVGMRYRALGVDLDEGVLWFWIGSHADYDKLVS